MSLCFALGLVTANYSNAADELPPARPRRPNCDREFLQNQPIMRDTHDPTLVEVMIQIDNPPVPMAFDVSIRSGNNKAFPFAP